MNPVMDALISPAGIANGSGGRLIATDPRVIGLAKATGQAIRNYCGWHVAPQVTETRVFDGDGGSLLQLPTLHLIEVDELRVGGQVVTDPEWSELGSIRVRTPDRYRSVEVTFTHGYDLERVADLVAVGEQVARNAASSPMGYIQESIGSRNVTLAQLAPGVAGGISLLERDLAILNAYRLESKS
jgi:hypothetical protein